jgi:hypothetical protein
MRKPKILVLYFTQTGQLKDILDHTLGQIQTEIETTYARIEPVTPWPWPWTADTFFDAMPETVKMTPAPVKPLSAEIVNGDFDLIIFGWQPWFLHPAQPVTAFLQSKDADLFRGKPVITLVGSRNMWLNAGEKVKSALKDRNARHIGNIVLTDTNTNLISLLTVIRWSFSGRKEASRFLPQAGVQDRDIHAAARFGPLLLDAAKIIVRAKEEDAMAPASQETLVESKLESKTSSRLRSLDDLQARMLEIGAIELNTGLVLLEQRGVKNFRKWAAYIGDKGGPGDPNRIGRVRLFKRLLLTAIFVLSPASSLTALIQRKLHQKRLKEDVKYFLGLEYEPGRI